MILAKVTGTVVTTISHPDFKNRRMLTVQPFVMQGDEPSGDFIALDNTHAGIGDTVLIIREGNGTRQVMKYPVGCVNSLIIGIIDSLFIDENEKAAASEP